VRFGVRYDPDHVGRIMHRLGLRQRVRQCNPVTGVAYPQFLPEVTSGAA
jgi:transposase